MIYPTPPIPIAQPDHYDRLLRPLPAWHPKAWYYGLTRLSLKTIGKLSDGIRLGFNYGFDSGVMLEYVYRNQPHGITPIGTFIDWFYLNSQGWRGIRARSELLQRTLAYTLESYRQNDRTCYLLDVACGGGRYDLEVLQNLNQQHSSKYNFSVQATLRDYKAENVSKAQQLAIALGVNATIETADAFSDAALQQVSPRPDVIVVSGLHEILPDDELIRHHFQQLYDILAPGGTLIFTIQPQHPQLELIARTLPAHTGKPWVMRLRSWETTRQWAEAAGLQNFQPRMESHGIFGVVTAEKNVRS